MTQFFLFLPQMRLEMDAIVERAQAAESAGFVGMAFMDHLAPPRAETSPMFEAITVATWVAARTERLVVGHLVLCDALRHPAVLARQAVTIDQASAGRFELGIGWGSIPDELVRFGVTRDPAAARVRRLGESLELITALWTGEPVTFHGEFFDVYGVQQSPTPRGPIPILIGGGGPRTLDLVRRHGDWCNVQVGHLDRLDEIRVKVGRARVSTQHVVGYVAPGAGRAAVEATTRRRFGGFGAGLVIGDGPELTAHFAGLVDRGVQRFYVWFSDFAPPDTLGSFGETVISHMSAPGP